MQTHGHAMTARPPEDMAARILRGLQELDGGEIRDGKLFPLTPVFAPEPAAPARLDMGVGWFAVHTNARAEFYVADGLRAAGFATFVPSMTTWIRHSNRMTERKSALFPRYVFVGFNPTVSDKWKSITSRHMDGVVKLLQLGETPLRVPDVLISRIMVDDMLKVHDREKVYTGTAEQPLQDRLANSSRRSKAHKSWKGRRHRERLREQRKRAKGLADWLLKAEGA